MILTLIATMLIVSSANVSNPFGATSLNEQFSICGDEQRVNCVVDGDTIWFHRQKIRIADIDAPELSPSRCELEERLGTASKLRLRELLNAGTFTFVAGARDKDRFGRKLRTIIRDGRSIGETLISEGLARRWGGPRRSWCD